MQPPTNTSFAPSLTALAKKIVSAGLLDERTAYVAQQDAVQEDIPFVHYLVQKKILNAYVVGKLLSKHFGLPLVDLSTISIDKDAIDVSDRNTSKLILKYRLLPLYRENNRLIVGISDPYSQQGLQEFQFSVGSVVEPILVEDDKLSTQLDELFRGGNRHLHILDKIDVNKFNNDVGLEESKEDAPVVRYIFKLLNDAIREGASDLHFEPYEDEYRVRFRIDGVLHEVSKPPIALATRLASRIKIMANLDISERRNPQDGRVKLKVSEKKGVDFRVSVLPTLWGEKIVMRILNSDSAALDVNALGLEEDQKKLFLWSLRQSQGMILATGPTGSGKTVSLYTGLKILNTPDVNISSAEDPVEIRLNGINQVNIHPKSGLTFAHALRSFLRQDPDIIMVGEVRDVETADIAVKASQTGHLVLSTLHTNSAAETLTRLMTMGIDTFNIASSLHLIIAQRLVRLLCPNCREPHEVSPELLIEEGFPQEQTGQFVLYRAVGCAECTQGYKGRTGIYEVVKITRSIQQMILERRSALEIGDQMRSEGFNDLRTSGLLKAMKGVTSLEEVNRVTKE